MEQYVITGIGLYNGLGQNARSSWESLIAGKSAIKHLSLPDDIDEKRFPKSFSIIKPKIAALSDDPNVEYPEHFEYGWKYWDRNTKACLLTVDEALKDSGLQSKNTGVVISTFGAGTNLRLDIFASMNNGVTKYSPRKALNIGLDFPAAQVAAIYKVNGPNTAMDSACTTGITSIEHAINNLKADPNLDAMIVGGADHMAEPIYLYWFQTMNALCLSDDITSSRPWDKTRSGFVMGEGAASIIIEPMSKAKARGAKIYGIIKSTSIVTLFASDTSPDLEGNGARQCVHQALRKANISANDIHLINAHATSTPVGDDIEFDCMKEITPNRTMVSNKGQIGHMMSSAGIAETIYTVLSMNSGKISPNVNLTDPLGEGMILPTTQIDLDVKYSIKNSFGFGGRNASLILERYND